MCLAASLDAVGLVKASSWMLDRSRKWTYLARLISTTLTTLSSRVVAALKTDTVLDGWRVKVVLG